MLDQNLANYHPVGNAMTKGGDGYRAGFTPGPRDVAMAIDELVGEARDRGNRSALIEQLRDDATWMDVAGDIAIALLAARDEYALVEAQTALAVALAREAARIVNGWSNEQWTTWHDRKCAHAQDEE